MEAKAKVLVVAGLGDASREYMFFFFNFLVYHLSSLCADVSYFLCFRLPSFFLYYHTVQIDFDIADTSSTQDAFHI